MGAERSLYYTAILNEVTLLNSLVSMDFEECNFVQDFTISLLHPNKQLTKYSMVHNLVITLLWICPVDAIGM